MRHYIVAWFLLASLAAAQAVPIPGGYLAYTTSNPPDVNVYDPATNSTTSILPVPTPTTLNFASGCAVSADRDVVVLDTLGAAIHRVDFLGNFTTPTMALLNQPLRTAIDHNGDVVFTGQAWVYAPGQLVRVDGTSNTPVVVAGPFTNPFGLCVDKVGGISIGDYLVTLFLGGQLIRVTGAGQVTPVASNLPGPVGVAMFPNGDYAVLTAYSRQIIRVPRNGGPTSVFAGTPALGNVKSIVEDGVGGFYVTEAGGTLGSRLVHVNAAGAVTVVLGNAQITGTMEVVAVVPHLTGPTRPETGPNGLFGLSIEFPQLAGQPYLTVVSGSVYPGIPLGGSDPRSIPLNPDPLFVGTFGGDVPGYTAGFVGTLDGQGRGSAQINLTTLPVGALAGTRVFLQTGVIDPNAPSTIADISNVWVLSF